MTRADAFEAIAWHEGPRQLLRHLFELADDSAEQIDGYINRGRILVALDDASEIIGHAQLVPTERPGTEELKSLAVHPHLQGCGIGKALVEHVLAVCRAEGVRAVTVATATADIDNIRFYQRLGFRATSIERDVFTEAKGYPPALEANGIPVRDSITLTQPLDAQSADRLRSAAAANLRSPRLADTKEAPMVTKALIVRLQAKPGQEETLADFLGEALPLVQQEPETIAWFALRIDASSFAIVDAFPDDAGRRAHLDGAVAAALGERGPELLAQPPKTESVDVIAAKLT